MISAFISPYRADRQQARAAGLGSFHEVYVRASIETCKKRDTKSLYRKARAGEIENFTGVSAPYEVPALPDFVIDTEIGDPDRSVAQLVDYIVKVSKI